MMNKDKLVEFCMLPVFKIPIESKPNHRLYWEWAMPDGTRAQGTPQFKRGCWKTFVDVKVSSHAEIQSYPAEPDDKAWETLLKMAIQKGYRDATAELYEEKCILNLSNGSTVEWTVDKRITHNKFYPTLTIVYKDNSESFEQKTVIQLGSEEDLRSLGEIFQSVAASISEAQKKLK
jgi:hypothetical protein